MGQEVTILGDQNYAQYCNTLVPHNREEVNIPTSISRQNTSANTTTFIRPDNNHLSRSTKGKEKVGCFFSSIPSPSSSKDSKQSHYEEINRLMKEFYRKCKLQCKGVDEYLVSLFDTPLSLGSHGKPSSTTRPYHAHFVKESGVPLGSIEGISKQIQNIDISPHLYGKGFDLMKNMGYMSNGLLGKEKGIIEPLET